MEILRYVVLVNALLAVVSGAFYVLLRRETFFSANRLLLWLGLAAMLLLPLMELPDWRPQPVRAVMHRTAQAIVPRVLPPATAPPPDVTITFPNGETYPAFPNQDRTAGFSWSWPTVLLVLYGVGVVFLLIRLGVQLVSLSNLIRRSTPETYADFTLVRNEQVDLPFSFFNWVVLNPDRYAPDALEQILRHERVHVHEWHSVDMLGAELVCIVFWFNPAAYLFRHLLHQALEYRADAVVLAEGVDAKSYQFNLVKVSLENGQSTFTNQFGGTNLRQRVGMMNGQRSGVFAWWRYSVWVLLMGAMALSCRHEQTAVYNPVPFPVTNATRRLAAELEQPKMPWFRQASLLSSEQKIMVNGRLVSMMPLSPYPTILCLRNNHLALKVPDGQQAKVFINGSTASANALSALTFEEVNDLFVYQKWEDQPGADTVSEAYRVFVGSTHKEAELTPTRTKWKQFLLANAISDHPGGHSSTFSMNKLLEATFFHNKLAFVERTKDNHLRLYDDYAQDIKLYINGLPVDEKQLNGVHVREVDKLYTRERSFEEWMDSSNRLPRYVLNIQTAPKRAKRDSSYYVFSPFYSGDF